MSPIEDTPPVKIAVLADVHANLPALNAVLDDANQESVHEIWNLGDFVGYGAFPNDVVQILRDERAKCIIGNYDQNVLNFTQKKAKWKESKHPSKFFSFEWTHRRLKKDHKEYLDELTETQLYRRDNKSFLLVHGSPDSIDEPLTVATPLFRFKQIAEKVQVDVILCGHTHNYFNKTVNGTRFINPGSVGRPFDTDTRASYVILELKDGKLSIKNKRVDYSVNKAINRMVKEGFPDDITASIALGKSLDDVWEEHSESVSEEDCIKSVLKVAKKYSYEKEHAHKVTDLSLQLFDQLTSLHKLKNSRDRILLQSASLLHDIGWTVGRVAHHKHSRDAILRAFELPFSKTERTIVAMVARYHRRAFPKAEHRYFCELSPADKKRVLRLSALLRFADGLDRRHRSSVDEVQCRVNERTVSVRVQSDHFTDWEIQAAERKADLFEDVFKKKCSVQWKG